MRGVTVETVRKAIGVNLSELTPDGFIQTLLKGGGRPRRRDLRRGDDDFIYPLLRYRYIAWDELQRSYVPTAWLYEVCLRAKGE